MDATQRRTAIAGKEAREREADELALCCNPSRTPTPMKHHFTTDYRT